MSACIVFAKQETLDPAELAIYARMAARTLEDRPVERLAFFGHTEVLEGGNTQGVVILEFPDLETVPNWYQSPAYQAARKYCLKGGTFRVLLIDGIKTAG